MPATAVQASSSTCWLLVAQIVSEAGQPLSAFVADHMRRYPVSGEINRTVADAAATIAKVRAKYEPGAKSVDFTDGISVEFERWRFNLRASNTEPIIRVIAEAPTRAEAEELATRYMTMVQGR